MTSAPLSPDQVRGPFESGRAHQPTKALTVWQPWASLIMVGAKPFEFRHWSFAARAPLAPLVGQAIVIHAGARPVRLAEVDEILERIADGESALVDEIALPLLRRVRQALVDARARRVTPTLPGLELGLEPAATATPDGQILPLACGLGTAVLGRPRKATALFGGKVRDSSRIDKHVWAWPVSDVRPFDAPVPMRGAQGFWTWPEPIQSPPAAGVGESRP